MKDILALAFKDYSHEWRMSSCFVLGLAAVLAPLMLLFGLKFGIVTSMVGELLEDPRNREIRPVGSGAYDKGWFDTVRRRPDVAFVLPRIRSLAAVIDLKVEGSTHIFPTDLIPTAAGDPQLRGVQKWPREITDIILAEGAAKRLNAQVGSTVDGSVARQYRGVSERVHIGLRVVDVMHGRVHGGNEVYAHIDLLAALERYKDGIAVPGLGWPGATASDSPEIYPGYRLYARSIYDVASLAEFIGQAGQEVKTNAAEIATVQSIDRNLSLVFWIIAMAGMVGFSFSLGASLLANVDRKRRDLSVLRLVGFSSSGIVLFPVFQALFTAVLGWLTAVVIYLVVERVINTLMANKLEAHQTLCFLLPSHFAIALGLTLLASLLGALLGGYRAVRIQPSEGLREI